MQIRAIRPDEIDRFAAFHPDENAAAQTRAYLARQLDAGHTRLAWCFVAEEGEQFLGRVAFWGLAGATLPDAIALLDLPWSEDAVAVGERLFDATLPPLAAQGVALLDYSLREPSPWHRYPDRQRPVLAQLGFRLMREAKRYDRIAPIVGGAHSPHLSYRTLAEVGDDAFAAAIARVSAGTLDRWIATEREEMGPEAAADAYLRGSKTLRFEPGWWQLGYTPGGQLAGLIMMAHNNAGPIVDYIGVVPEQRGQGLVDDLLAQGLAAVGLAEGQAVRADIDTGNWPIQRALERAGFAPTGAHWDYQRPLHTSP